MAALPHPLRKGLPFLQCLFQLAARLSLAAAFIKRSAGKARPYRTGCGKAAMHEAPCSFVGFVDRFYD